jgi:hypothetical protein
MSKYSSIGVSVTPTQQPLTNTLTLPNVSFGEAVFSDLMYGSVYVYSDELLVVIVKCVIVLMLLTTPIDWPSGVSAGQFETTNDDATNE